MTDEQVEAIIDSLQRVATAWESIAHSAASINSAVQRVVKRYAPEPKPRDQVRDAVVTRIPNEEDRAKEAQGASTKPIGDWLSELEEEIGPREKVFLEERDARTKTDQEPGQED